MFRTLIGFVVFSLYAGATAAWAPAQGMPPNGGPPPPSSANASSTPSPAMVARAKSAFVQLQSGTVDRSQLTGGPYSNMTEATVANAEKMVGGLGKPVSFVPQQTGSQNGITYSIFLVTFKNGEKVDFLFAVDGNGKITSMGLGTPH